MAFQAATDLRRPRQPPLPARSSHAQELDGVNAMLQCQQQVTQRNIDRATEALPVGDYKATRRFAQAVTRGDPKRAEAWYFLGTVQMGVADWKRAAITYMTALKVAPQHPEAHAGLGMAVARVQDPRAAGE
jgi:cytochrome c-type biogenesis protein CcmH/NrfG